MKLNYTNNFQMDGSDGSGFGGDQPTSALIREGMKSADDIIKKYFPWITKPSSIKKAKKAMEEYASQFTASAGAGSVNTLLAEVLSKYIKYIRDVDGTDYILVHDERYASDVKFTDEQWQLLTDVAKK